MRHHNEYTPTQRLILRALQDANGEPLSIRALTEATGASFYTIAKCTQRLVHRGVITRRMDDCMSFFTLPVVVL